MMTNRRLGLCNALKSCVLYCILLLITGCKSLDYHVAEMCGCVSFRPFPIANAYVTVWRPETFWRRCKQDLPFSLLAPISMAGDLCLDALFSPVDTFGYVLHRQPEIGLSADLKKIMLPNRKAEYSIYPLESSSAVKIEIEPELGDMIIHGWSPGPNWRYECSWMINESGIIEVVVVNESVMQSGYVYKRTGNEPITLWLLPPRHLSILNTSLEYILASNPYGDETMKVEWEEFAPFYHQYHLFGNEKIGNFSRLEGCFRIMKISPNSESMEFDFTPWLQSDRLNFQGNISFYREDGTFMVKWHISNGVVKVVCD